MNEPTAAVSWPLTAVGRLTNRFYLNMLGAKSIKNSWNMGGFQLKHGETWGNNMVLWMTCWFVAPQICSKPEAEVQAFGELVDWWFSVLIMFFQVLFKANPSKSKQISYVKPLQSFVALPIATSDQWRAEAWLNGPVTCIEHSAGGAQQIADGWDGASPTESSTSKYDHILSRIHHIIIYYILFT